MRRNCIIVSPYFPPSTLAGVHRARHLAKHLPAAGWQPIVLSVDEAYHEERLDPGLAALVPATVEVVKVPALPASVCRPLGVGEISLRAWRPLRLALFKLLDTRQVGAVLITGSPYYPMLLAGAIKHRFGVPVVLDFQDPWVSAWGARQAAWSKVGRSHRLATWLEPRAVRAADFVTAVSDTQNAEMAARYPWLDRSRMAAIPIGCDPDDFTALRSLPADAREVARPQGANILSFVGTFMPRSEPLMRVVLRAFARCRELHPGAMAAVRLNFIGTSNQPNDTMTYRVRPLAEEEGVADAVHEVPQRVPYLEALGALARSDGILLIGSDEPHYTASKIYPALMSGRPFLSLFHHASSAHAILSEAGGGIALAFETQAELEALAFRIASALETLVTRPASLGRADPAAYGAYEAHAIAGRFAEIFDSLADV